LPDCGVVRLRDASDTMALRRNQKTLYYAQHFSSTVINSAARWYLHFQLSLRDTEELLFERGVIVTHESIRCCCDKFGQGFALE
jgi:putative transposase